MLVRPQIAGRTFGAVLLAFATASQAGDVDLPRYPSISPDGEQVVFSWRGDLWMVPVSGGDARRLTTHPGVDTRSAWRPDGELIAFESNRDGYRNIWVMRPDGSGIRQVVETDRYALLNDFGPGPAGSEDPTITFDARVEGDFYRSSRPYEVPDTGGPFTRVHDAFGTAAVRSPSGDRVLFERGGSSWTRRHYRGPDARDVWSYSPEDGFARLTTWEGNDGQPRWQDEETMIFMSDRDLDSVNLHRQRVVPGVEHAERLTDFEDRDITAFDVSRDGKTAILQRWDTLYSLDLTDPDASPVPLSIQANEDGMDRVVPTDVSRRVTEAALSPDGKVMAFVAYGDVWVRNVADSSPTRRVSRTLAHDRDIAWSPDGLKLYFVSDEDGVDSIYAASVRRTRDEIRDAWKQAVDPEPEEPEETQDDADADEEPQEKPVVEAEPGGGLEGDWIITTNIPGAGEVAMTFHFEPADDGMWSFTFDSPVFTGSGSAIYDEDSGELEMTIHVDNGPVVIVNATVNGQSLTGAAETADGPIPVNGRRVQDEADAVQEEKASKAKSDEDEDEEADPAWDPDRWHDAIEFDVEPVLQTEFNDRKPQPSPDGTMLAFRRGRGDVMVHDLSTSEDRMIRAGWDPWSEFTWAPDSRSLAVAMDDRNFNSDIWLVPVDDPESEVNVSRHPDNDGSPSFSADGRVLVFVSERKDEAFDVYRVHLDKSLDGMLDPELKAYYEDAAKAAKKRKPIDVRKPTDEPPELEERDWEPSLDDAYRRLRRMSTLPGNERSALITPGGDRILYSNSGGGPGDAGIWSVKWDGTGAKRIGSGSMQHLSTTGDKVITVSGGGGWLPVVGGTAKTVAIDAEIDIDLEEQSSRKFDEATRVFGAVFYDPDMHGTDWDQLTDDYHVLASRAWTGDEFNWVAARLLGELNASHTGIRTSTFSSKLAKSQGRLGTIHAPHADGFEVIEVVEGSPAAEGPMPLEVNDVIVRVEGEPIGPTDTLEEMLRGKVGEEVVIGIRREVPAPEGEEEPSILELDLLIEPTSAVAVENLRKEARERGAQRLVDEASGGRIGYLHVRSMNQTSLDEFERDLYAVAENRDGLIIDVRNNGGGWTADRLLASIMATPHAYTVPRGSDPQMRTGYPQDRLFIQRYVLPINMICNEKSFSNAEIISHAFKTLDRGTLVGQQTYGGVISTGGTSLVDGTSVRLPFRGWFLLDGTDMENNGARPDILVPQTPEDEAAQEDAQLQAAIEDLIERLPPREEDS